MDQPARQREQPDTVSTPASVLPLQRSAENRVIGGVCGGLAERTDIDPIIFRVLAAVLTLVGGAGLILYGAAMLLVPDARTGRAPLGRLFSGGQLRAAGVVLTIVCLLVLLGGLTGVFGGASLSIVVIAVLAVLVAHRRGVNFRDMFRGHPSPPHPGPVPPPAQQFAPAPPPYGPPGPPGPYGPPPQGPPTTPPPGSPYPQGPPPQGPPSYVDLSTMGTRPPTRRPRLRSITGWVWLLAAVVGGGVAWLQHRGELPGDVRVPMAVALAVLGVGMVVSTWVGRAAVKGWGVLLTIALGLATVAGGTLQNVRWEPVTWTPRTAGQLAAQQPYRAGVAAATLDLTELPLTAKHTYRAGVTMSAGRLVVLVPKNAAVDLTVRCDRCAGDALGTSLDGTDRRVHRQVPPGTGGDESLTPEKPPPATASAPTIDLDLTVRAGNVEVRRAA